ncbi:unnamed protein product [Ranitomeya imitator]|uniref:Uncharacterized protein n=1 Tax=Ranitomeya imitator TaxID=111125 RepID=A0ABN9KTS2_9NEOB|nr:unnamed protein product [Ranitomeya imitator]
MHGRNSAPSSPDPTMGQRKCRKTASAAHVGHFFHSMCRHGSGAGVLCSALLRADKVLQCAGAGPLTFPAPAHCSTILCPQEGRAKYACAGAVAEDQKRTSWKEDRRRRSGPETPIRPDQQRDRPWNIRLLRTEIQKFGASLQQVDRACCHTTGAEKLRQALSGCDDILSRQYINAFSVKTRYAVYVVASVPRDALCEGPGMTSRSRDRDVIPGPSRIASLGTEAAACTAERREDFGGHRKEKTLAELQNNMVLVKMDLRKKAICIAEQYNTVQRLQGTSGLKRTCNNENLQPIQSSEKRPFLRNLLSRTPGQKALLENSPYSRVLRARRSPVLKTVDFGRKY